MLFENMSEILQYGLVKSRMILERDNGNSGTTQNTQRVEIGLKLNFI